MPRFSEARFSRFSPSQPTRYPKPTSLGDVGFRRFQIRADPTDSYPSAFDACLDCAAFAFARANVNVKIGGNKKSKKNFSQGRQGLMPPQSDLCSRLRAQTRTQKLIRGAI